MIRLVLQRHTGPLASMGHGVRVGWLTLVERHSERRTWTARCDCGALIERSHDALNNALRHNAVASCGCRFRSQEFRASSGAHNTTHGYAARDAAGRQSRTYRSYQNMIRRCADPDNKDYAQYGGAGIAVCDRWLGSFENFLADVGERPHGMTVDRIDGTRGYEPGNVRWATPAQQAQNRRSTRLSFEIVQEVRGRVEHGESQRSVASRLGIDFRHVNAIVKNKTWIEAR